MSAHDPDANAADDRQAYSDNRRSDEAAYRRDGSQNCNVIREQISGIAGRALDHIGFEVTDIEAFAKRIDFANGINLDEPIRTSANSSRVKVAFITDPWGTRIELTQGLAPAAH